MIAGHKTRTSTAVLVSLVLPVAVLNAQPADPEETPVPDQDRSDGSTLVYTSSFFEPYHPVSVSDMLDRIPGVSVGGRGGGRGLGTGGDLLINGQRVAGKDNSPREQLDRISASEVERIEIIRGTSGGLDVRGSGQVVNIVLNDAESRASTQLELIGRLNHDNKTEGGVSVSHNRQTGEFQALLNFEARPNYENRESRERQFDIGLTETGSLFQTNIREQDVYEISGNMSYRLGDQRMQLNMLYSDSSHPRYVVRSFHNRTEHEDTDHDYSNWEIGGDYDISLRNGHRAQVLFIATERTRDFVRERFGVDEDQGREKTLFTASNQRTRERILQTNYSLPLTETQDIRVGVERALTQLESSLFIGTRSEGQPVSDRFGGLSPQPLLSNPGSTVEETRYEGFLFHNWAVSDRMSLESSLVYETSEISQTGVVRQSRRFNYVRPSFDVRYDLTDSLRLRATAARNVSQLSFAAFAATANTNDREQNVSAGNPNLVPEESLRYELGLEYRLPEDSGVINTRLYYQDISNYIGRTNATIDPARPLSAVANVGPASRWGIFNDASVRLGFAGLPDAIVSAGLNIFDSRITDPFLGTQQRINRRGEAEIGFRHDVTSIALSYGLDYRSPFHGGEYDIDIRTITRNDAQPSLNMFVSKVLFNNITFRLESNNTLNQSRCRERRRYEPTTLAGELRSIEESCSSRFRRLTLRMQTTF